VISLSRLRFRCCVHSSILFLLLILSNSWHAGSSHLIIFLRNYIHDIITFVATTTSSNRSWIDIGTSCWTSHLGMEPPKSDSFTKIVCVPMIIL
jgi:hypothetical protein